MGRQKLMGNTWWSLLVSLQFQERKKNRRIVYFKIIHRIDITIVRWPQLVTLCYVVRLAVGVLLSCVFLLAFKIG